MTPNPTPTPEVILWRGIRFDHTGVGDETTCELWQATIAGETLQLFGTGRWIACFGEGAGEGDTPEEALEAARSQVESIARAVGLIPESRITKVEAGTITDAMRYPENGYHHCRWCNSKVPEPHEECCWYKRQCEQVDKARALVDQLAAKLGKGGGGERRKAGADSA